MFISGLGALPAFAGSSSSQPQKSNGSIADSNIKNLFKDIIIFFKGLSFKEYFVVHTST